MLKFKLPFKIRIILTVVLVLTMTFACEEQNDVIVVPGPGTPGSPGNPGTTVPTNPGSIPSLSTYMNTRISTNLKSTELYIRKYGHDIVYNYQSHLESEIEKVSTDMNASWINGATIASQVNLATYSHLTGNVTPSQIPGVSALYNNTQLALMNTYFNNMYSATSATTATNYYNTAVTALNNNTTLTSEQKTAVRTAYDYANKFAQNYFGGSYSYVVNDIYTIAGRSSSSSSCVNWKGAWRSGVVGGVAGGIAGAYAGATGGTVALPGFGTVGGAVGGGVFGFAGGFISGAVGSIATDVLFNCLGGNSTMIIRDCSHYTDFEMRLQCEKDNAQYNMAWRLPI